MLSSKGKSPYMYIHFIYSCISEIYCIVYRIIAYRIMKFISILYMAYDISVSTKNYNLSKECISQIKHI